MIPGMLDSRGDKSKTLTFVSVSWAILTAKFAAAGLKTPLGIVPDMSAGEFGAAVALILGIWLGREWQEKKAG